MKRAARAARYGAAWLLAASAAAGPVGPSSNDAVQLRIGVEGNALMVQIESPLAPLLGFDHAPRGEHERSAVRELAARLRSGTLFVPNAEAGCMPDEAVLASEALGPALLGGPQRPRSAVATAVPGAVVTQTAARIERPSLRGSFTYVCTAPAALQSLTVGLADAYRHVQTIEVWVETGRGRFRHRLSGDERTVRW